MLEISLQSYTALCLPHTLFSLFHVGVIPPCRYEFLDSHEIVALYFVNNALRVSVDSRAVHIIIFCAGGRGYGVHIFEAPHPQRSSNTKLPSSYWTGSKDS